MESKKPPAVVNLPNKIDAGFYRDYYPDLSDLSKEQLLSHWETQGLEEGRVPTLRAYLQLQVKDDELVDKFLNASVSFYSALYEDLTSHDMNENQLFIHYFSLGKSEGRYFFMEDWVKSQGVSRKKLIKKIFDTLGTYLRDNEKDVSDKKAIYSLLGLNTIPVPFLNSGAESVDLYTDVANELFLVGRNDQAVNCLHNAIYYGGSSRAFELMGNVFVDKGVGQRAVNCFEESIKMGGASEWVYKNLSSTYMKQGRHAQALVAAQSGVSAFPESGLLNENFIEIAGQYWEETSRLLDGLKLMPDSREEMISLSSQRTKVLFDAWQSFFTYKKMGSPCKAGIVTNNDSSRVLIIGDYHVNQCTRYRINQKVEQLSLAGHIVATVDWTGLEASTVNLPFYDIVIFYRVPAYNSLIRQVALTKAMGKLAIYEVDDLIFDSVYPSDISTYGGSVDLSLYYELKKGMVLNNAFIRLCDYSISSTEPLSERLSPLVLSGEGYVHRNGLDSLSNANGIITKPRDEDNELVTLFYGSGTLAHNTDFIDLVLPSLKVLLRKYDFIQLVIVGHLTLPDSFLSEFKSRCKLIPKVKVSAYLSYLSKADINLAVLHSDIINDCKSELKWFEAACFKIPSIVSSTQNYRDVVTHGKDALLASSSDDWTDSLERLVVDRDFRITLGESAYKQVLGNYSVESLGSSLSLYLRSLSRKASLPVKPKLCLVNVFFPPQSLGGATRVVSDNFDTLIEQYSDKFELCVFTSEANFDEPYKVSGYNYKGVRVYKSTVLFRENMDWHPKDSKMGDIFREFLALEKPDKIHFHCVQRLTASVVEAARDMAIPYIVTAHDAWWISDHQFLVDKKGKVYPEGHTNPFDERVLPDNVTLEASLERESYLKGLLSGAESVLTVSDAFAAIYRKNGIRGIHVTRNGISASTSWAQKQTNYTEKVVCAHIGGMSAHKGYDLFQDAMLTSQPLNISVLVVDHSRPHDYVSTTHWGVVEVNFIGRQSQESIVDLYGKIDVLFAPSVWPESFGLVTRESVACGCWVVASNIGGIGEDIIEGETGHIISPDEEGLLEVIDKIDKRPSFYKGPSKSGKVHFTANDQVSALLRYYEKP